MSGRTYRTEIEIIADILEDIMETGLIGIHITNLVRNTNLSHNIALNKIGKLMKADLVKSSERERRQVFIITEKGIKFFHELTGFEEMVKEIRASNISKQR